MFQDSCVDKFLTGKENLCFHAQMYHMDKKTREERIAEVLILSIALASLGAYFFSKMEAD